MVGFVRAKEELNTQKRHESINYPEGEFIRMRDTGIRIFVTDRSFGWLNRLSS